MEESGMFLRFGNLEDIILVKKLEINLALSELSSLVNLGDNKIKKCEFHNKGINCGHCDNQKECREEFIETFKKIDILEGDIKKMLMELELLHLELNAIKDKEG
jgi:hypothetical protein